MPFDPVRIDEKTDLTVKIEERDGQTFTVTSGTVTITSAAGVAVRSAVAATADDTNKRISYLETFSAANGYAVGTYTVVFAVTLTVSGTTYIRRYVDTVQVKAASS